MKRLLLLSGLLALALLLFVPEAAEAQWRRPFWYTWPIIGNKNARANARVSQFRGTRYQFGQRQRYWSVGGGIHSVNYWGDLAPGSGRFSTDLEFTRPGFSAEADWRFSPNFGLRFGFAWYRLKGDDYDPDFLDTEAEPRYIRNLSFRNDIKELSAVIYYDIFQNVNTYIYRNPYSPYVFAGIAGFLHNPRALAPETDRAGNDLTPFGGGDWVDLQPLGTEGQHVNQPGARDPYSLIQIAGIGGIGLRTKVGPRLDLSVEIQTRFLTTDYVDDVSGGWADPHRLAEGENGLLARAMGDRSLEPTSAEGQERDLTSIMEGRMMRTEYFSYWDPGTVYDETTGSVVGGTTAYQWDYLSGFGVYDGTLRNTRGDGAIDYVTMFGFRLTYIISHRSGGSSYR